MERRDREQAVRRVRKGTLLALLLIVLWLAYRVVEAYLAPIILAVVLAALLHPFHLWLAARLRGHTGLAALLTCALVLLVLLGPVALLAGALVREGAASLHAVQHWVSGGGLERLLGSALVTRWSETLATVLPGNLGHFDLAGTLTSSSSAAAAWLLRTGGNVLGQAGVMVAKLVLMIFVLFYFLRDGERLLGSMFHLIPLDARQEERLIRRFKEVSRSAILGAFGTAAAQGIAGGIGFTIVGIQGLFWGTVMALASLIPVVGTGLVWVPAALYLVATGSPGKALFLVVYCGVTVGSIDNLVRPLLMSGQARMSTLWLFLALLGGIDAFGLMGLIYGPLVFGLLAVLLFLYEEEFQEYLDRQEVEGSPPAD